MCVTDHPLPSDLSPIPPFCRTGRNTARKLNVLRQEVVLFLMLSCHIGATSWVGRLYPVANLDFYFLPEHLFHKEWISSSFCSYFYTCLVVAGWVTPSPAEPPGSLEALLLTACLCQGQSSSQWPFINWPDEDEWMTTSAGRTTAPECDSVVVGVACIRAQAERCYPWSSQQAQKRRLS